VKGEYFNPFNGFIYSDFDEWLEELDLDNWGVVEWLGDEHSGGNPYLLLVYQEVIDHYQDFKRGYETTLKVYEDYDGHFWGYESTFYPFDESHHIGKKGRVKKKITQTTEWKFK
jgi:hypothetical protein